MARSICRSQFVSHPGKRRRVNEDAFIDAPDHGLWAIADGMGGHVAGELASRTITETLGALTASGATVDAEGVAAALVGANQRLRRLSVSSFGGSTLGATVAVLVIVDDCATCLWAGDSRVYRWRDGDLVPLTRDHTWVEELLAAGRLTPDLAASHRLRNYVTRAVGAEDGLRLERRREAVSAGDRFLLCSDGLDKVVDDAEIAAVLAGDEPLLAPARLVARVLERGAPDNVTVGVVCVDGPFS